MPLPHDLIALLNAPSIGYLATLMPDGSPQLTQVWVDTDGERVLVNTTATRLKARNVRRDPRVAITISDPRHPGRFFQVRGRATVTRDGAEEHVDRISQKYTGGPFPRTAGDERVVIAIAPESVSAMG